nr:DUF2513 domain-containing protein [Pseudomaricurvus sp. HS19]
MEIIRSILLAVEEGADPDRIDGATDEQTRYHQALLIEAGLLDGSFQRYLHNTTEVPDIVHIHKLTWEGHEFIDEVRQSQVWNTIKSEFKDASFSTVVSVAKDLAEGWAKRKVQQIINQ